MRILAIATLSVLGSAAVAQDQGAFTYEMFETAVQHVNLEECPGDLAGEGRFCRMTMHNDAFHVFAFTEEGEQPMVGLKSWYEDEIDFTFK
jgi:hypothetical protein